MDSTLNFNVDAVCPVRDNAASLGKGIRMDKAGLFKEIHDRLHAIGGRQYDIAASLGISKTDVTRMMRPGAELGSTIDKALDVLGAMGVRVELTLVEGVDPVKPRGRYGNKIESNARKTKEQHEGLMAYIDEMEDVCL